MISYAVVTTCNARLWEQYGRRMVDTFCEFWPGDVPLHLYAEDFPVHVNRQVIQRRLPDWLSEFKGRHEHNRAAQGRPNGGYEFRQDCVRFSHKVAALTDAAASVDVDVLIWMDADTVTHQFVTKQWLASLFDPAVAYIAWLNRNACYPEAGFFMLNARHPEHHVLMQEYRRLYESDDVLHLAETHDAYVLQQLMEGAAGADRIRIHSLSGRKGRKCSHPLPNSRLAECLDHLKGQRKKVGKSKRTDLHVPRSEPYWQRC